MAETAEPKKQFADFIRLHFIEDRLVDRVEEQAILREGISRFGLTLEDARGLLMAVAAEEDVAIQREEEARLRSILRGHAERGHGYISQAEFEDSARIYRGFTRQAVSEIDARRTVKRIMVQEGWRPRRGSRLFGSRRWFARIPD